MPRCSCEAHRCRGHAAANVNNEYNISHALGLRSRLRSRGRGGRRRDALRRFGISRVDRRRRRCGGRVDCVGRPIDREGRPRRRRFAGSRRRILRTLSATHVSLHRLDRVAHDVVTTVAEERSSAKKSAGDRPAEQHDDGFLGQAGLPWRHRRVACSRLSRDHRESRARRCLAALMLVPARSRRASWPACCVPSRCVTAPVGGGGDLAGAV